jgi:hypothetical protein
MKSNFGEFHAYCNICITNFGKVLAEMIIIIINSLCIEGYTVS